MNGQLKFFNRKLGFGFIAGEDGVDYFVRWKGIVKEIKNDRKQMLLLQPKTPVTFEIGVPTEKGPVATDVSIAPEVAESEV